MRRSVGIALLLSLAWPLVLAGQRWFGFNAGSTPASSDLRIGVVATNTMLAGAAGGSRQRRAGGSSTAGLIPPSMTTNSALAGNGVNGVVQRRALNEANA